MLSTPGIKAMYSRIQKQLFYMIPEKWDKIYLYASIIDQINNLQTGELYFYYYPKGILKKNPVNVYEIPYKFNLEEEMYLKLVEKLYNSIKELRKLFKKDGEEIWTNLTIKIENFKFIVEYSYDDLRHSEYSNSDRHLIWVYENLDKPLESFKKPERDIIKKYLSEDIQIKKDIYTEPLYKNHVPNIIQYKQEKETYIYDYEDDEVEYEKEIDKKTYTIVKSDKKEKYKKQKKKEIKPKPKEKTYVEQIEEQKHAVKSQIISKKID